MIARQLIMEGIIPVKTSDTGKKALTIMEDLKVSHLPIVNNEVFLGLVSEGDIYQLNQFDEALGNHKLSLINPFVNEHQHVYEVLQIMGKLNLSLVPVLSDHNKYLGSITFQKLLQFFTKTLSIDNPGGVIVLEMSSNDYSMTEIANIVESSDAKVLSSFVVSHSDSTRLEVVVKVNRIDLGNILQTFDRFGYFVKASFGDQEDQEDLKERYDSLMNYLNI